jgi:TPR repeat protein
LALGYLYRDGEGVSQNYTETAFWYRKAAEQGDTDAQKMLGILYSNGQGVPQDYVQAALWYRKAAEQGNAQAQRMLGLAYGAGMGVPRDFAEAYFWLDVAMTCRESLASHCLSRPDMERAAELRDDDASGLTPADLSRAQERARKWFEEHQAKP